MEFWQEQKQMSAKIWQVQKTMEQVAPNQGRFAKIINDLLANQGKMLRPALLMLMAGFDQEEKESIHLAAALEFLHMASLVHDDIIDRSPERRGIPSVVKEHGTAMAIYTGDYLIYLAAASLASLDRTMFQDQSLDFMAALLEAEAAQLEDRFALSLNPEEYLQRIESKTGLLFSIAATIGYGLRQQTEERMSEVKQAGLQFGLAFQLRDDLLDFDDPAFGDLKEGKLTLPILFALKEDVSLQKLLDLAAQRHKNDLARKNMVDNSEVQAKEDWKTKNNLENKTSREHGLVKNQVDQAEELYFMITEKVRKTTALEQTQKIMLKHLEEATASFKTTMQTKEFSVYGWMIDKLFGVKL